MFEVRTCVVDADKTHNIFLHILEALCCVFSIDLICILTISTHHSNNHICNILYCTYIGLEFSSLSIFGLVKRGEE